MDFERCEVCGPGDGWTKLCGLFRGHILCVTCSRRWMELGEISWNDFFATVRRG